MEELKCTTKIAIYCSMETYLNALDSCLAWHSDSLINVPKM